jgi:hypothetical protein
VPSSRYERAIFWVALAGVVLVVGGIFVSLGATQVAASPGAHLWANRWFVIGICVMGLGVLALWWALTLYMAHRHAEGHFCPDPEAHRLPKTGPAALRGTGPEVLSFLRKLRTDLRDATGKIQRSKLTGKFWSAGPEGNLPEKTWQKNAEQLQGMSGMNPLWNALEDAFAQVHRIQKLRTSRVFGGYRVHQEDDLDGALGSVDRAITQLEAKIASLDDQGAVIP